MQIFKKKFFTLRLHAVFLPSAAVFALSTAISASVLISSVTPMPEKKVYLTFDDGPSEITEEILDILDEENIKATFFVIGPETEKTDERLLMLAEKGHKIGLHSYSHKYSKIYSSTESFMDDITEERQWIYDVTGIECDIFRFPGGSHNSHADKKIIDEIKSESKKAGLGYHDWNCDGEDSIHKYISAQEITQNVLKTAEGKEEVTVLLHDSGGHRNTAAALREIITYFREKGYTFSVIE